MSKISSMMDIGKRSMLNSQSALQTVSHNIANKATEGYSRQRVELTTAQPIGEGNLQIGMGTRASLVTRTNNPWLEKQIQGETGKLGFEQGRTDSLQRVEQVFNEQMNKGLNQYITDFFNSFRELSNNPESTTSRTMVKEASEGLVMDFKRVINQLEAAQKDADEQIRNEINEVNKMVREVATLNEKVAQVEIQGMPANDARDRRDLLLKKLTEKIDIKFAEGSQGMVTVSTAGNAILVSGYDSYEIGTYRDPVSERMELTYAGVPGATPFNITDRVRGGTVGGAISVRDHVIEDLKEKIDSVALTLAEEVNKAHTLGFDRAGRQGVELFQFERVPGQSFAKHMKLNESITLDVNRIAAGAKPGAAGDNTVANVISQIQNKALMDGGSATIDDYYNSQVGSVGVLAQRAVKTKESQQNILNQLSNIRESISGVSLDEETTNMIEFQKAFEASARVIKAADEMLETVLSLKRM
ncbi:MAG: flagellar hook-associated protein FlgK [Proteobacteria bacterium]|jgi:flagellar hook-associated protein 1 FlgK|nr:flagellar hook-associated protein FlgK [Pseudomonadota bacterium]